MKKEEKDINKQKYVYKEYDPIYQKLFEREKKRLLEVLPKNTIIEHVGSSSVLGLGGKGIVDIAIYNKNWRNLMKLLPKRGYKYKENHPGDHKRKFFERIIKRNGNERRYHLHLCLTKEFFNSFVIFRDYLRKNDEIRDEYAKIKKMAVKKAKGDGRKYFKLKFDFLHNAAQKAFEENSKYEK